MQPVLSAVGWYLLVADIVCQGTESSSDTGTAAALIALRTLI